MSSTQRGPSQIPPNGTYAVTADLSGAAYSYNESTGDVTTLTGAFTGLPRSAGAILYDMGKTVFLPATGQAKTQVLRKVQVAPFEGYEFVSFYIKIGGTGTASPVARL
jgi:hypothetical protein